MLSHGSLANKSLTKTDRCAGAIVVKEKLNVVSPFFGAFPSYCNPKATKDSTATIPVNYTSELREGFEASACNNLNTCIINVICGL